MPKANPPSLPFLLLPFFSLSSSQPPPKESVPRPRSLTSFGHLSGANRFIQENRSNHVPVGASPRVPALTGHPPQREPCAHAHTHRIPWGRGLGKRMCVLAPVLNTDHFATALRHFGFPRTTGAFWERGATPGPNGSTPEPQRGGACARNAEEHRVLRTGPALNKEGLFNVAVELSPAAAGADTIVSAALSDADACCTTFKKRDHVQPFVRVFFNALRNRILLSISCWGDFLSKGNY